MGFLAGFQFFHALGSFRMVFCPIFPHGFLFLVGKLAKDYISEALAFMLDLGKGNGPMNHAFMLSGKYALSLIHILEEHRPVKISEIQ